MKIVNIIGAAIVLLANIYVSFNHSIELFKLGGFGELAYIGVIGAEVTFLLGVLNVVVAKLHGKRSGIPAKAGFALGVGLILWSNINAGLDSGIIGIILGAITPASLIIAEMIISKAILQTPGEATPESPAETETTPKGPTLLEAALEIYNQQGKIPTRRAIMEATNASEWEARKTLENLKSMT